MLPAVEQALDAMDLQDEDAAFVQVARLVAKDVDSMPRQVREVMFPQHAGMLLRAFDGLEKRAKARQKGHAPGKAPVSQLDRLREAQANRRKPA
jgi:hypothetical protein